MSKATVEKAELGFEYWATRPYLKKETQERLKMAEILLVPKERFRENDMRVFPFGSDVLFARLQKELGGRFKVDVAIEDGDYKQLSLHSVLIDLGTFVVTSIAVPVLVSVLSNYLKAVQA